MKDSWSPLLTKSEFSPEFLKGLDHLRDHDWAAATYSFQIAQRQTGEEDIHRNLYLSYHGLSLVQMNDISGLNLCRRAAEKELFVGGVFANLARVEITLNHRQRAYDAVRRGLRLDPEHVGLRNLRLSMGTRRTPIVPFLSRDHIFNQLLGKLTYRGARRRQPFRGGVV